MTFLGALLRSVLSAAYWFGVLVLFYGSVAGDRDPAAPPPTALQTYAAPVLIVTAGILVYALLLWRWPRFRSPRSSGG